MMGQAVAAVNSKELSVNRRNILQRLRLWVIHQLGGIDIPNESPTPLNSYRVIGIKDGFKIFDNYHLEAVDLQSVIRAMANEKNKAAQNGISHQDFDWDYLLIEENKSGNFIRPQ